MINKRLFNATSDIYKSAMGPRDRLYRPPYRREEACSSAVGILSAGYAKGHQCSYQFQ